jgi:hypothetical protein
MLANTGSIYQIFEYLEQFAILAGPAAPVTL